MKINLKCRFGIHLLDSLCSCARCHKVKHRKRTRTEWVEEEGIDPGMSYIAGPWLAQYTGAEYRVTECARCGEFLDREGPLRYRG